MSAMVIRKAEETDLPRIMEIERDSFHSPWPETLLRQYLGEEGFMVCEEGGQVVGYILVGLRIPSLLSRLERQTRRLFRRGGERGGGRSEEEDLDLKIGHIMNLAVDPAHRRRGLGSGLLQAGLDHLRRLGAQRVELEVRTHNRAAICLYRKFGFTVERLIKHYYSNGDDAYLMRKSL